MRQLRVLLMLAVFALLSACGGGGESPGEVTETETETDDATTLISTALLGERLFSDTSLSLSQTQSCATCHNPEKGFIDDRDNGVAGAVSLGDDAISLGSRNSPTISYASLTPDFTGNNQNARGGQFLDGRASDLTEQAGEPFLNALEMNMPDRASVIERITANPEYVTAFENLYGTDVFNDTDTAFESLSDSLASFQETQSISPFDSKYDRAIAGTYTLSNAEAAGQALFFSNRASCQNCHHVNGLGDVSPAELFTNHQYENIGVPANAALNTTLMSLGQQTDVVSNGDQGLFENPAITTDAARGRFRVSTLRNSAVTAPYMHNGVFRNLQTVLHFYDHQGGNVNRDVNPETGQAWGTAEVNANISNELNMRNLSDADIDNLECFLRALTDAQFEEDLPALRAGLNCS